MNLCAVVIRIILLTLAAAAHATAGIAVRFEAAQYDTTESDAFVVAVVIDGDDTSPELDPVADGLYSYGAKIRFSPANAEMEAGGLQVVTALNYNAFVPGAAVTIDETSVSVRGNIRLTDTTRVPYPGTVLFSVTFQNNASAGTVYSLVLESARTIPSQTLFVDGAGNPLDESIVFGAAEVVVSANPDVTRPRLMIRPVPPGAVEISYELQPVRDHFIEVSGDLDFWTDLFPDPRNEGSVLVPVTGTHRYFRLRTVPFGED